MTNICQLSSKPITGSFFCSVLNIFIENCVEVFGLNTPGFGDICESVNRKWKCFMVVEDNGKDIKQIKCNGLECGWEVLWLLSST